MSEGSGLSSVNGGEGLDMEIAVSSSQPPVSSSSHITLTRLLESGVPPAPILSSTPTRLSARATELPQAGNSEASMQVLHFMTLAALAYVEFGHFGKSYITVVSDLGCLFLDKGREKEIRIFINLKSNIIKTKFWREDPSRKSHDHVRFLMAETLLDKLIVEKPGRGRDIFKKIQNDESFFVNSGQLAQLIALYQLQQKDFITDVTILKKMSVFDPKLFKDLKTLERLIALQRKTAIESYNKEITQLQHCMNHQIKLSYQDIQVSCANCNRRFRTNCDLILHTKIKPCKLEGKLSEKINTLKSSFSAHSKSELLSCGTCNKTFKNKAYFVLHQEIHIGIGYIYPCSKCARIFLSSYYHYEHKCFHDLPPKRTYQLRPVENIYGKIDRSIVRAALTCPVCEKKCDYISQLFSHLHIGSPCLFSILSRLVKLDHQLSFDYQELVQMTQPFEVELVWCEVCGETCVGQVSYIMHMDHHKLKALLDCEGCYRLGSEAAERAGTTYIRSSAGYYFSLCSFYGHSCHESNSKYCVFCHQFNHHTESADFAVDTDTTAQTAVDLLAKFANYTPPEGSEHIIEDEDLGLNSTNLSFLDYFESSPETVDVIELN